MIGSTQPALLGSDHWNNLVVRESGAGSFGLVTFQKATLRHGFFAIRVRLVDAQQLVSAGRQEHAGLSIRTCVLHAIAGLAWGL